MEFRVLGPLEVVDGDSVVVLAGAQRALLALLLLNANEVVSADRLIEELWGEHTPESGRTALQVRVSQLRKALGKAGGLVITRAPGYVLRVEEEQLDLARFERLVSEADAAPPSIAALKLREALALWRGPPLAALAFESFAQPAIARMEELRLGAVEKRVDADLALDRHAEVVAELEALTAQHPLRERLRGQLMLALYRCGRQADALAVYQSARRALVDGLGIEPSPSLRELEQSILRQEPTIGAGGQKASHGDRADGRTPPTAAAKPSETATNLPAPSSSFVGRSRELAELRDLLSHTRMLTMIGEGGIGKTRLALQLASHLLESVPDGVWVVDLAAVAEPKLVAAKLADTLGVRETPDQPLTELLVGFLSERSPLVILDNCEHVIDGAAELVGRLLKGCPRIVILATSREPLGVDSEEPYRVSSLAIPPPGENNPERLIEFDAVRLLVDRVREHDPEFGLDASDAALVTRLCRQLEGLPLGIELAAAGLRRVSLAEMTSRLDERSPSVSRRGGTGPGSLEALLDSSSGLLNPAHPITVDPRESQELLAVARTHEPFLVVRGAGGRLRVIALGSEMRTLTVGRRAEMDVSIDWDGEVSGLHAELYGFSGEWTIVDDGLSTNGTFVNDNRLRGRLRLRDGDRVRVGRTVLVYRFVEAVPVPRTVSAGELPHLPELTDTQQRLLVALCRPYRYGGRSATPASNAQIAAELLLTAEAVESQLDMLATKFQLQGLPQDETRVRLAECVMQYGLISAYEID